MNCLVQKAYQHMVGVPKEVAFLGRSHLVWPENQLVLPDNQFVQYDNHLVQQDNYFDLGHRNFLLGCGLVVAVDKNLALNKNLGLDKNFALDDHLALIFDRREVVLKINTPLYQPLS